MCTSYKFKKTCLLDFFLINKGIHIINIKKEQKSTCHSTAFYSIFNMSSCRKPDIYNDLPNTVNLLKEINKKSLK